MTNSVEWLDIETAPKDGRAILLFDGDVEIGEWQAGAHSWNAGDWWIDGGQVTAKPTHWAMLPQPPHEYIDPT